MTWTPGDREEPGAETGPALEAAVAAAGQRAGAGRKALEHLALLLADVGANADHDRGRAALRALARSPKLVVRLDEHTRQVLWHPSDQPTTPLARLVAGLSPPMANSLTVALASTHRDGRVRERAVLSMLDDPDPDLVPFLVLRTGDWVRQVRDRARAGLALLLADDPATYLPAAMPMALLVDARSRGGFAANQAVATLLSAPPAVRRAVGASGSAAQRRLVVEMEVAQRWLRIDDLVALAESEADVRIRSLAAEAACREAVWTERLPTLRRLAGNRRPDVRATALIGLLRLGEQAEVVTRLDDSASLVRAIARAAARRVGTDARAHYRAAVTGPAPTPGAVLGFSESASETDAPLLNRLLTHPAATIRAAAVRGLRQLDAVETSQVMPLLTDPSPAVVREATTALRPIAATLPAELPWQLLAGARVELRRAGYRLLGRGPVPVRLRAALFLAVDPDAGLSRRGRADVTGLVRDASRTTWRRTPLPTLDVTPDQHADLLVLAWRAAPALGDEVGNLLTAWLAGPPVTV